MSEALDLAHAELRVGNATLAESIYRRILAVESENDVALYFLGLIAYRNGKLKLAAKMMQKAVAANPREPNYHNDLGLLLIKQWRLDDAEQRFEAALVLDPNNVEYLNNLGNLRLEQGRAEDAIASLERAAAIDPRNAKVCFGLGLAFHATKALDSSVASFRRVLELDPGDADAHTNLGLVLCEQEKYEDAVLACQRALALDPTHSIAHNHLGLIFQAQGRLEDAEVCFQRALTLNPNLAEAHNNLGVVLSSRGQSSQAVVHFRRAVVLKATYVQAHNNLANALRAASKVSEAITCLKRALVSNPKDASLMLNLGNMYVALGMQVEARTAFERVLATKPDDYDAYNQLGHSFVQSGEVDKAMMHFRKALAIKPDFLTARQNLLFCMSYLPGITCRDIHARHVEFGQLFEKPLMSAWKSHSNDPNPDRRLRLGYVSGNFREHAVMYSFEPLLKHHDKGGFELYCYSSSSGGDVVTERLQGYADCWRNLTIQSDESAAAKIRDDGIDILVDLAGHASGNRLMVFAHKPAPVQVSWLGYVTTTGLTAIDYRITDQYTDPVGTSDAYHSETLWRIPSVTVYQPPRESPPINALPVLDRKPFTFASLNNLSKITHEAISLWSRILAAVSNARLMLRDPGDLEARTRLVKQFAANGIGESQLRFVPMLTLKQYLALHHEIDLALDPFPYNGGVTSCHSLWMGVPFVTLEGNRYMARMGVSLLSNIGLPELIATNAEEYVALACRHAADPSWLAEIRMALREKMLASLADAERFTCDLESAYRSMWRAWCEKVTRTHSAH